MVMSTETKEDLLPEILNKVDQILSRLDDKPDWISGKEAANMLGIGYNHFINRRASEFPCRKGDNNRTYFQRKAIEAVINQRIAS